MFGLAEGSEDHWINFKGFDIMFSLAEGSEDHWINCKGFDINVWFDRKVAR